MKIIEKTVISRDTEAKISVADLPPHESDSICRTLVNSVTEYFKLPGIAAEYKKWLAERQAQNA